MSKTRYVIVGLGGRSHLYAWAVADTYSHLAELVGLCDINPGRMDLIHRQLVAAGAIKEPIPTYTADRFDAMIAETRPDKVIVTCGPDVTHSDYVIRAMELGCDVVCEKPLTIDEQRAKAILEARRRTGRNIRVNFNYRYAPHRSQIKRMLSEGVIGEILSVDFTWPLDTRHGADYFRRWHRYRKNSGSLLVHKATHHFDLVNWWLGDLPEEVFCHASRKFYTPKTAERLGLADHSERCLTCPVAGQCQFRLDLAGDENLKQIYLDCEADDGYFRDRCVFADDIDIWDNMSVSVRYRGGAMLNYLLIAYSPWEGYQIAFNGTKGRLEHGCVETSYISGEQESANPAEIQTEGTHITLYPMHGRPQKIEVETVSGGHGGGDPLMLADLFEKNPPADPLGRRADHRDGVYSILTGIAAYHSIDTHQAVRVDQLLDESLLD